ncbi:hypothetical protein AAVH_08393 [Aphelenchoides avenae]|nr:hypothetical protein AAVH_08393 [Aphelenchus avenae]
MRSVQIKVEPFSWEVADFTDFWINAYYTSFPCHHCSGRSNANDCSGDDDAEDCSGDEQTALDYRDANNDDANDYYEVFHLTPPEARQCLTLKYAPYKRINVVSCIPDCYLIRVRLQKSQQERSVLRSVDLRYEAFKVLPRVDLDTCLLVNRLWSAEVDGLSPELALRKLILLKLAYNPYKQSLNFTVIDVGEKCCTTRIFTMPRNAAVDSAIAVNHLRNCTAGQSFEFDVCHYDYDDKNLKLDYSVRHWMSSLLVSIKDYNLHFNGLYLRLGRVSPAHAVDFLSSSSIALRWCAKYNALRNVSLAINYEALEDLVEECFLQLTYVQSLEHIKLSISVFGPDPPDDHSWIRGLFQLPNCKMILVKYTPRGQHEHDCSEDVFGVLQETVKHFESASDVSGFPDNFEFVLKQDELTWDHQEPPPTYSNVPMPLLDGFWNVYVTKNMATDVPLSVYVNMEENRQEDDEDLPVERHLIFRKELCIHEPAKTSRPRKRHLQ